LKNQNDIDCLVFAKGIDMQLANNDLYNFAFEKNSNYLGMRNKRLLALETNVRFLGHHFGSNWTTCFGGGLSSIALAANVKKCYIASGVCYTNMHPVGSNFITDRLWSNAYTEI